MTKYFDLRFFGNLKKIMSMTEKRRHGHCIFVRNRQVVC